MFSDKIWSEAANRTRKTERPQKGSHLTKESGPLQDGQRKEKYMRAQTRFTPTPKGDNYQRSNQ